MMQLFQVDGNLTQNENFADITGFQIAYSSYLNSRRGKLAEGKLPGLNMTLNQVFFLTAAQVKNPSVIATFVPYKI
jgi:predicted metalloendopeptidase